MFRKEMWGGIARNSGAGCHCTGSCAKATFAFRTSSLVDDRLVGHMSRSQYEALAFTAVFDVLTNLLLK